MERIEDGSVRRVIVATNPTVEGEATASICRAAEAARREGDAHRHGHSGGQRLEFADEVTMWKSLENRREM